MSTSSLKQQADSFFQKQDYKKAIELYTQAIEVDPSCEAAAALFSNRSLCHHKLDNFEEALNDGVSATSIRPTWSRGYLRVANAAESLRQNEKALEAYEKSLELEPSDETKGKFLALFKKNLENTASSKTQEELKLLGNEHVVKQKFDEALVVYTAAIDLDPSVEAAAAIYSNRSLCYFNLKKFQEAYDDGSMATVLRPEWPRGWLRRASAATRLETFEEADDAYDKFFELEPSSKADKEISSAARTVKKVATASRKEKEERKVYLDASRAGLASFPPHIRKERARKVLMYAVTEAADLEICKIAMEGDPDINNLPNASFTPNLSILTFAIEKRIQLSKERAPLAEIDRIIMYLIDETAKRKLLNVAHLYGFCCWTPALPPNPHFILSILEKNQINPNERDYYGFTPLCKLVDQEPIRALGRSPPPPEVVESLRILLSHKSVNVNATTRPANGEIECTPLMMCFHPELSKILLRHGADINFFSTKASGFSFNVLTTVASRKGSLPFMSELLSLLIGAGATLRPDGKGGKSSSAMGELFSWNQNDPEVTFPDEESLQLMLQLNKKQGLELRWVSPDGSRDRPFLHTALISPCPPRIIELMCSMSPEMLNYAERGIVPGAKLPLQLLISSFEHKVRAYQPAGVEVFKILLERGADLTQKNEQNTAIGTEIVRGLKKLKLSDRPFKNIVVSKFGEEYWNQFV